MRKKAENIAWKGDQPTSLVVENFKDGFIKPGDKVVDIGCGFGRNANWLESQGVKVVGININREELEISKKRAEENNLATTFVEASATNIPLADGVCDVAIDAGCSHMLNAKDQEIAEREQARVVKTGGYLIYFGFSKNHPSYLNNPTSPQFRDLEDVRRQYEKDFEILNSKEVAWAPSPEEGANFDMHRGIEIVMRRR